MFKHIFLCSFLFLTGSFVSVQGQRISVAQNKIVSAPWVKKEVSPAISWKYYNFEDLFESKQSITVIEVDPSKEAIEVELPHVESGFVTTSQFGEQSGSLAAINGSFFNTKTGGSTVFLKQGDSIYTLTGEKFTSYRENAGFAIDQQGSVSIVSRPPDGWASLKKYPTLLASGPLLLRDNQIVKQKDQPFNTNRHPRTAIGTTKDGKLIAVVVDGRNANAHGASIKELSIIMKALGCVAAMNLDGGGSSTAWVKDYGVVNFPSDNKKFDHLGERAVANAICFKIKQ